MAKSKNISANQKKRKQLSDNELIIEMNKLWSSGERGKTNFYELLRTKFRIAKNRCLQFYDIVAQKASSQTIEAQTEANIQAAKETVLLGIKTKNERILILQKEVDECLKELYDDDTKNFADFGGSRKMVKKQLTVFERTKIRQTIKELQSEISKIEGDYAPTKVASTDPEGNAAPPVMLTLPPGLNISLPSNIEGDE